MLYDGELINKSVQDATRQIANLDSQVNDLRSSIVGLAKVTSKIPEQIEAAKKMVETQSRDNDRLAIVAIGISVIGIIDQALIAYFINKPTVVNIQRTQVKPQNQR